MKYLSFLVRLEANYLFMISTQMGSQSLLLQIYVCALEYKKGDKSVFDALFRMLFGFNSFFLGYNFR